MRNVKLAGLIGIGLSAAILFSCLQPASSLAELQIKAQLLFKKTILFLTLPEVSAGIELSRLTADRYQTLVATTSQQLQRQLDAQLQAAKHADSDTEANLYLEKALSLEQKSAIALESSGALLFSRAMLRLHLQQYQQAIDLLMASIDKFDQSESEQLLKGDALNHICRLQTDQGLIKSAIQWCEQFTRWTRQSELATQNQQSNALDLMANLKRNSGLAEQARDLYLESIQLRRQFLEGPDLSLANSLQGLAAAYTELHQFFLAEKALLEALHILNTHLATTAIEQSQLLHNIAENQKAQGKYEQAFDYAEQARALLENSTLRDEGLMGAIYNQIGSLAQDLTRYDAAEKYYLSSLNSFQSLFKHDHPNTAAVLNNLGSLYSHIEDYEKSKVYYQKALLMRKAVYGEAHIDVIVTEQNLALVYQNMDDMPAAINLFESSLASMSALAGPNHPHVSVIAVNLGRAYSTLGDPRAETLLRNALVAQQSQLGAYHPQLLPTLYGLAQHYRQQQQFTEAEMLYLRALKIAEASLPELHPDIAACLYSLAKLYQLSGNYPAAEEFYKKELAILQQINSSPQEIRGTLKRLVQVLEAAGKTSEAQQINQKLQ
ncbi:tetratricopeptide repeat protein [Arsukibacterium sp.]|uniref:tetratricopeptide repeat protein n=1 Tax=Arsukibacterium sp. TaxID=1977258 RepID=UPI001BD6D65E|nr:tetratricopeptide repeat protein [Arsukibacterium sp.]